MEFTNEWFTSNIPHWEKHLLPLKDKKLSALEIGSFEGKSAVWLLENVLTDPESRITCVDSFQDYPEATAHNYDWAKIKQRFINNTSRWKEKVTLKIEDSTDFLKGCTEKFDLIYIDGNHYCPQVLIDAVLSHLLLKPGGLIIFDDYLYGGTMIAPPFPKGAIDSFMTCFCEQYEPVSLDYQVILRKRIS